MSRSSDAPSPAALTPYADLGGQFGRPALGVADMLAAPAAAALGRTLERLTQEAQAQTWQHALASRDVIGHAKGILVEQRAVTADEAFQLLRETSQRLDVKLRDIAEGVVARRRLPVPDPRRRSRNWRRSAARPRRRPRRLPRA